MLKNIIHLLSDIVCNQIAAGEVINRPSSVVKELLDNAIDAQSTKITLIVEDSGNSLIQVIDNGIGMSTEDMKMCLEKHATSKIKTEDDLFNITTMGFRGEAIPSIISVAQVEIISCQDENGLGSKLVVEGGIIKSQTPVSATKGTIFTVKNLFYNIPVRRNFLKSPKNEMRHIIDEITRSALSQPNIEYILLHNGEQVCRWQAAKLYDRIIDIFGDGYRKKLLYCYENTDTTTVEGYVCEHSCARKTRDYQFLFVNKRYIRSPYLQKAIFDAYSNMIPNDRYPCYVLFLTLPPSEIDVNIHPSKTEIHFHNEELLYAMIKSVVIKSLYKYDTSEMNFENDNTFFTEDKSFCDSDLFENKNFYDDDSFSEEKKIETDIFENREYKKQQTIFTSKIKDIYQTNCSFTTIENNKMQIPPYILTTVKSGILLIHQDRAEERISYERSLNNIKNNTNYSQQLLFQQTIQLSQNDYSIAFENKNIFTKLGFNIEYKEKFLQLVIIGYPNFLNEGKIKDTIDEIIKNLETDMENEIELFIKIVIKKIIHNYTLSSIEIDSLINQLFACSNSRYSPSGETIFKIINFEDLENLLREF